MSVMNIGQGSMDLKFKIIFQPVLSFELVAVVSKLAQVEPGMVLRGHRHICSVPHPRAAGDSWASHAWPRPLLDGI